MCILAHIMLLARLESIRQIFTKIISYEVWISDMKKMIL